MSWNHSLKFSTLSPNFNKIISLIKFNPPKWDRIIFNNTINMFLINYIVFQFMHLNQNLFNLL